MVTPRTYGALVALWGGSVESGTGMLVNLEAVAAGFWTWLYFYNTDSCLLSVCANPGESCLSVLD